MFKKHKEAQVRHKIQLTDSVTLTCPSVSVCLSVRKQDIIKVTEQLIEAISNGDFESYTYVTLTHTPE